MSDPSQTEPPVPPARAYLFLSTLVVAYIGVYLVAKTYPFWTVDFIRTEGGAQVSSKVAAFLSTPFDLCGAAGIVLMGWVFGRLQPLGRQRLLVAILGSMTLLLALLPRLFHAGLWVLAAGAGYVVSIQPTPLYEH